MGEVWGERTGSEGGGTSAMIEMSCITGLMESEFELDDWNITHHAQLSS